VALQNVWIMLLILQAASEQAPSVLGLTSYTALPLLLAAPRSLMATLLGSFHSCKMLP
jgi:hypothetical protein